MNRSKPFLALLAVPLALSACDLGPTEPAAPSQVSVQFGMSSPSASTGTSSALFSTAAAGDLVVTGTNGTLRITQIGFIVSELELERLESTCDNGGSGNRCDDYEAPISFVKLPLSGGAVTVATDAVPHGDYDELDFEVEDLKADSDDGAAKRQEIAALLNAIRTTHGFGDFPERASMVVQGSFTPSGGTESNAFRAYFDAEIKVEIRFDPLLTIDGNGSSRSVTVDVQPAMWFSKADGTVLDLSELDFATTGELVELKLEAKKGFTKVRLNS